MNYEQEFFRASLRDGASIESLPQNSATNNRNRIVNEFCESIGKDARRIFAGGQDPRRYCERIMKGGRGDQYKYDATKKRLIFQEKIYAVEGENGYEGIVERIFTKTEKYNSIPEKISDETLNKINKETGHNFTRFELLLLAGYVFVESDGNINIDSITGCVPAICYIDPDYDFQNGSLIQNYKFTDSNGKELDGEEIKKLVEKVMTEIENEKKVDVSQGEPR